MNKSILKTGALILCAVAVATTPLQLRAGATEKPAAEKEAKPKKLALTPFNGNLKAVDATAKTISVGKQTIHITSETAIFKIDQPGKLADGVVGEKVSGAYRKEADGKLIATKITFGTKPKAEPKK